MNRNAFDQFCRSLDDTHQKIEWGKSSVWYVGETTFAMYTQWDNMIEAINFKVDTVLFDQLSLLDEYNPTPRFGLNRWIQVNPKLKPSDADIQEYLRFAHTLAVDYEAGVKPESETDPLTAALRAWE